MSKTACEPLTDHTVHTIDLDVHGYRLQLYMYGMLHTWKSSRPVTEGSDARSLCAQFCGYPFSCVPQ